MKRLTKQVLSLILMVSIICSMSVTAFAVNQQLEPDNSMKMYTLDEVMSIEVGRMAIFIES